MNGEPRGHRWERRIAAIAAWIAATLVGLVAAATTRIGPTVITISATHGAHLGDLLAFAVSYIAALVITVALLRGR